MVLVFISARNDWMDIRHRGRQWVLSERLARRYDFEVSTPPAKVVAGETVPGSVPGMLICRADCSSKTSRIPSRFQRDAVFLW